MYKVIAEDTIRNLEQAVNRAMGEGYEPIGGVQVVGYSRTGLWTGDRPTRAPETMYFYQAMLLRVV